MDKRTPRPMTQAEQARALGDIYAVPLRGASNEAEQDLLSDPPAERLADGDARPLDFLAGEKTDADAQGEAAPTEPNE